MSFFQVGWSPIMTIKSQVLALKYRPQTFKDLIGHEEIATTIYNSIKNNNSANAFLLGVTPKAKVPRYLPFHNIGTNTSVT